MFNAGSLVRPGRMPVLMLVLAAAMRSAVKSCCELHQTNQPVQVVIWPCALVVAGIMLVTLRLLTVGAVPSVVS